MATLTAPAARARAGALMAVGSMLTVQVGLGSTVGLIDDVGAEGAAWLRLTWAGVIFLLLLKLTKQLFVRLLILAARIGLARPELIEKARVLFGVSLPCRALAEAAR